MCQLIITALARHSARKNTEPVTIEQALQRIDEDMDAFLPQAITLLLASFFVLTIVNAVSYLCRRALKEANCHPCMLAEKLLIVAPASLSITLYALYYIPAYTPIVTLSNAQAQTHTFVGMLHVGRGDFYARTHDLLVQHRESGSIILHEGIGMTGPVTVDYNRCSISKSHTVIHQPFCLGLRRIGDFNADLSLDDFMDGYITELIDSQKLSYDDAVEQANKISSKVSKEREQILNSVLHTFSVKLLLHVEAIGLITNTTYNDDDNKLVILKKRNQILTDYIIQHPKTTTAYGLSHFVGLYDMLQAHDASWVVEDISFQRAM